jgi:hypothetical protein
MNSRLTDQVDCRRNFRQFLALFAISVLALLVTFPSMASAPPWEAKDWTQWTPQDCIKILSDSPWAVTFLAYKHEADGNVSESPATARISSSLVIRQAIMRMRGLPADPNRIPHRGEIQKRTQVGPDCLDQLFQDRIVITISSGLIDEIETAPEMNVSRRKYSPLPASQGDPIADACGARTLFTNSQAKVFVYPRVVDGKPVIGPNDGKFTIVSPWRRDFEFNVRNMVYKGKPDF